MYKFVDMGKGAGGAYTMQKRACGGHTSHGVPAKGGVPGP